MTRTLVVGAAPTEGADDFYRGLLSSASHVVAADAAGEWCVALGRIPDIVVGDFDSAAEDAQARLCALGVDVRPFPADKDLTDLELAVGAALELGDPITVTAAFTRRPDHTLAAFGTLAVAGADALGIEPAWTARVCVPGRPVRFDAAAGETVSVQALGAASGVGVSGTRWPLADAQLAPLSGHGVSNVALGGPVCVECCAGTLIVMVIRDDTGSAIY